MAVFALATQPLQKLDGAVNRHRRDHGARRAWTVSMISVFVDALKVDRGDAEVGVAELALDDDQRHALARHLDRMRVAQLVRRARRPTTTVNTEPTPRRDASAIRAADETSSLASILGTLAETPPFMGLRSTSALDAVTAVD